MKKSKVMLVWCTLILAAVGATASKINHRTMTVWYSTGAGCLTVQIEKNCFPGATGCTTQVGQFLHVPLYGTTDEFGHCSLPLQEE